MTIPRSTLRSCVVVPLLGALACSGAPADGQRLAETPVVDTRCTWSVREGAAGGTITSAGAYTAPPTTGTFHVVATCNADPTRPAVATVTVVTDPPVFDPTGTHFLVADSRLADLRRMASDNTAEWRNLMAVIDGYPERASAEDLALAYLSTGNGTYARRAFDKANAIVDDLTDASGNVDPHLWYEVGDYVRPVALTLNWCGSQLTTLEQRKFLEFMRKLVYRVWFDNGQGGWQINYPGGNFHHAYLEATAFAGYSFRKAGWTTDADLYLGILEDKLTRPGGVMDALTIGEVRGGDFYEGANYGQRSKQRLFMALALIASQGGANYFTASPFFQDGVSFLFHQTQPGARLAHPTGNMARTGRQVVGVQDRYYMQLLVYHLPDGQPRRMGQWFLENVVPDYDEDFWYFQALWMDLVFKLALPSEPPDALPTAYLSPGTGLAFFRSDWTANATGVAINGFHRLGDSHQQTSLGGFSITRLDFQTADPVTSTGSGCGHGSGGTPPSQNVVVASGADFAYPGTLPGMGITEFENTTAYGYAQVDATGNNATRPAGTVIYLLDEWTRELVFVKPDVVVVYDRVAPRPGTTFHNRFHFGSSSVTQNGGVYGVTFRGGAMSVLPLGGSGTPVVRDDTDLGSCPGRRMEVPSSGVTRYLTLFRTAAGSPPPLSGTRVVASQGAMDGIAYADQVVLFSSNPRGAASALPFSYTVPGDASHTTTLVNVTSSVQVTATRSNGSTTVTVSAGSAYTPSAAGIVRFTD